MKNLSVGEAFVQRKDRKRGELHFISPRNETYLLNSFSQVFRGQSFTTLDTEAEYSWAGHEHFSKDFWEYENSWRILRGMDCSKGQF